MVVAEWTGLGDAREAEERGERSHARRGHRDRVGVGEGGRRSIKEETVRLSER